MRLILGVVLVAGLGARFADYLIVGFDWAQEPPVPGCQPPAAVYLDHVLSKTATSMIVLVLTHLGGLLPFLFVSILLAVLTAPSAIWFE